MSYAAAQIKNLWMSKNKYLGHKKLFGVVVKPDSMSQSLDLTCYVAQV
jgi:hypothetical protein